jgi:hypothetical protein
MNIVPPHKGSLHLTNYDQSLKKLIWKTDVRKTINKWLKKSNIF